MTVELVTGEDVRLVLTGAVGVADSRALREAALGALAVAGDVVVDLAATDAVDTAATQVLLALRAELVAGGRHFRLVDVPAPVTAGWRVLGVAEMLG